MTYFAIALSSILSIASFPVVIFGHNLVPGWVSSITVWITFVPLIIALRKSSPKQCFRTGYLFGLFANAGIFFWIIIAMQKYGNLSIFLSASILLAMVAALAFYPAILFWSISRFSDLAPSWLLGSVVLSFLSWTLHYVPAGGFPWGSPAYGLYASSLLIQVSDVVGISGLNFMILLGNFVAAEIFRSLRWRSKFPHGLTGLMLIVITSSLIYGKHALRRESQIKENPPLQIALLQGNIPQDQKWGQSGEIQILSIYRSLTAAASKEKPDLVVWPEASLPMAISQATTRMPFVEGISDANMVIGAPTWSERGGKQYFYNTAFVVTPKGEVLYRYNKRHLVPFGEYVPLADFIPMRAIVPSVAGNFEAGRKLGTLPQVKGSPYAILICYEMLFPELSIDAVRSGAQFLVNITNDAWFDYTSGPFQHSHFAIFRAIETRRSVVRAANTGITTWVDPTGKLHRSTRLFTRDLLQATITPRTERTFYVRYPMLMPVFFLLVLILTPLGVFRSL
jgi:apolipoprotein N-acyltransferase